MDAEAVGRALRDAIRLHQRGNIDAAEKLYRQVLAQAPEQPDALHMLGWLAFQKGDPDAENLIRRALRQAPQHASFHASLAAILRLSGRPSEALGELHSVAALQPTNPEAHFNVGVLQQECRRYDEAIAAYQQAIRLKPDFADAFNNLGQSFQSNGEIGQAIDALRSGLRARPSASIGSNLVYATHFHPAFGPREILEEHLQWGERFALPLLERVIPHRNDRSENRPLRIGYVSPNFCGHVLAFYHTPLLSHHEHREFQIVCYSDTRAADTVTTRLRRYADLWRDTADLSDEQLAQQIRADGIDILVDLTMHMAANRLLTFARKPAPIQISWCYPGTTGNPAIDYRLTDGHIDPPMQNDQFYSEKSIRLPHSFFIYDPMLEEPAVDLSRSVDPGMITFGCLNNFAKVNHATFSPWANVLRAVEGSRLILLAPVGSARKRVQESLGAHGIDPSRIEFIAHLSREQYLSCYNRIDIALDAIPYTGHTTTMDALWMGVPTISVAGATACSRGSLSVLSNVGQSDLVTENADDFVRIAVRLARDTSRLAELRQTMRQRLRISPLMDGKAFAAAVERIYRNVWREWCRR